jgi:hypothetical protein
MSNEDSKYLSSKEMMKELKVSSCELMHLRTNGKLNYIKKGNKYLYRKN